MRVISWLKREIRIFKYKRKLSAVGKRLYIGDNSIIVGGNYITIGTNFSSGNNTQLQVWKKSQDNINTIPKITIGNDVSAMNNFHVSCTNEIRIGDGCLFGDNVFITDNMHGKNSKDELGIPPINRKLYSKGSVVIGNNVWVGRNVCILPGVRIGDGAIIGANAVVTHNIQKGSVAVGVPAKCVRHKKE